MIPQIGFNACYNDAVGSPQKCLAFAIIQSCAASSQVPHPASQGHQPSVALWYLPCLQLLPVQHITQDVQDANSLPYDSLNSTWPSMHAAPHFCRALASARLLSSAVKPHAPSLAVAEVLCMIRSLTCVLLL